MPDCGKVCSEVHVPSFLSAWDELRQHGVSRLLCVAVGDAAAADAWARSLGDGVADGSKVQVAADVNGAFTRFLGLEQGGVDAAGARCLRYAAVVDDGILLKVVSLLAGGDLRCAAAQLPAEQRAGTDAACDPLARGGAPELPAAGAALATASLPMLSCPSHFGRCSVWTRHQPKPRPRAPRTSSRCSRPCTEQTSSFS